MRKRCNIRGRNDRRIDDEDGRLVLFLPLLHTYITFNDT